MTATTVLICTVAPSAILISCSVPAAGDGISASTLSVEISNSGSSRWTVSPTFLSHLVSVPSVIDSPIWGITTSVGMAFLSISLAHSAQSSYASARTRRTSDYKSLRWQRRSTPVSGKLVTMSDLKAAVIGTGGAGRLHLEAYAACPYSRPVAVVSHSRERATALAAEHGIRGYTSVEEMLERERPDVVSVATLEWDHEAPVLLSLAAGANVLCEKIMADTLASGEKMLAAASAANRTLGVNYNYRAVPALRLIREEIRRGSFGAPALFAAHMHAYLFPHLLDLLRYFFGDPVEVTATALDDQALRPPVSTGPSGRPWKFGEGD